MPAQTRSLADELNARIDCEDLAYRLGLERRGDRGNFKNPHTDAKHTPTLSVFRGDDGSSRFLDHRTGDKGRCIDLYMLVRSCDAGTAIRELAEMYNVRVQPPEGPSGQAGQPRRERTLPEWIADKCIDAVREGAGRQKVMDYLTGRGIAERAVVAALEKRSLGFNDWTSPTTARGEPGYGGEGVAFIVRHAHSQAVLAVDTRYFDAEANGKVKTNSQGEKSGVPWCSDWRRFHAARRVYLVESSINALSIDSCGVAGAAAVAVRGTGSVKSMDWRLFIGKQVVLAFDNDEPLEGGADAGYCPGLKAAWHAHEQLVALDIPALMLDQDEWTTDEGEPINDLNDYLQEHGVDGPRGLTQLLKKLEPWAIPGLHGDKSKGKPRLWLPAHDFGVYWRYRVRDDFTSFVDSFEKDEDTEKKSFQLSDVCGFRVAGVSRVRIASTTSMMTGDKDLAPSTLYSISVQVPRESGRLLRRVVADEHVHNVEVWKKLGPVFSAPRFSRLLNIMERAADIGAREAINFVGLAWKNGRPVLNEGRDCYFTDPAQQCPYHNLVFPSGPRESAREVIAAYQATFGGNAAALMLVWALGAHLKAYLGFWPHFALQADKGTGKDVLTKRLERTIGMQMFSRQTMQTEFRILGSVSFTSHPVGWGEISANKRELIAKALHTLQESYQYTFTTRGTEKKEFLLCAPVLLMGEEVDAKTLQGKLVRNEMSKANRGPLMPDELPPFPVREWIEFLAATPKARVRELHDAAVEQLTLSCVAGRDDAGAERMLQNYAGMRTAWTLLADFAQIDLGQGGFLKDLTAQMNAHIKDSVSDRQPWVWIVDCLLSEISRGTYRYPFAFDSIDEEPVLAVRTSHVMDHISREVSLREFYDQLPVKSDRTFKAQLKAANVVADEDLERTCHGKRVAHMVALSLPALEQYGLHAARPVSTNDD